MRPLSINFAPRGHRVADRIGYAMLFVAIAAGALLSWHRAELIDTFEAGEAERTRLGRSQKPVGSPQALADRDLQRAEMRFARRVIEQLDAPWHVLFAAIESTYEEDVTLLGIEPEPERREVRLLLESKDTQAMLAYLRQLRASPVLREVWLVNHQINALDPLRPVRFSISARWMGPPPPNPRGRPAP